MVQYTKLLSDDTPKYLVVELDGTLTFNQNLADGKKT